MVVPSDQETSRAGQAEAYQVTSKHMHGFVCAPADVSGDARKCERAHMMVHALLTVATALHAHMRAHAGPAHDHGGRQRDNDQ